MKKISLLFLSIVIAIFLILSLVHIQQNNKEIYKHRRQNWLKMIDYDEYNRDYTGKGIVIAGKSHSDKEASGIATDSKIISICSGIAALLLEKRNPLIPNPK